MSGTEGPYKFSLRDLIIAGSVLLTIGANYEVVQATQTENVLKQDKENAIYDLRLQTLELRVSAIELDVRQLQRPVQQQISPTNK